MVANVPLQACKAFIFYFAEVSGRMSSMASTIEVNEWLLGSIRRSDQIVNVRERELPIESRGRKYIYYFMVCVWTFTYSLERKTFEITVILQILICNLWLALLPHQRTTLPYTYKNNQYKVLLHVSSRQVCEICIFIIDFYNVVVQKHLNYSRVTLEAFRYVNTVIGSCQN